MTETFPFQTCKAADPAACRSAIAGILRPGMDWSEVHCGRCDAQGIVRHADLSPAPAAPAAPLPASPEPIAEPVLPEPAPSPRACRWLCTMRLAYLKRLEGWGTFGKGWGRRVAEVQAASLALPAGTYDHVEADLPDPVPTVRGAPVQVAATRTAPGKAAVMTVVGVVGDQASAYAGTFQSLSDIAPVFRYLFAACTVIGVLVAVYKAVQLAQGSEAAPPKPTVAPKAGNDDTPDDLVAGNADMVPGAVFELPHGTVIQAATGTDPVIAAGVEGPVPAEQAA